MKFNFVIKLFFIIVITITHNSNLFASITLCRPKVIPAWLYQQNLYNLYIEQIKNEKLHEAFDSEIQKLVEISKNAVDNFGEQGFGILNLEIELQSFKSELKQPAQITKEIKKTIKESELKMEEITLPDNYNFKQYNNDVLEYQNLVNNNRFVVSELDKLIRCDLSIFNLVQYLKTNHNIYTKRYNLSSKKELYLSKVTNNIEKYFPNIPHTLIYNIVGYCVTSE